MKQRCGRGVADAHHHPVAADDFLPGGIELAVGEQWADYGGADSATLRSQFMDPLPAVDSHASLGQFLCSGAEPCVESQVHHGIDADFVGSQVERGLIAIVIACQHDCGLHGLHRIAINQALRCRCQQYAGEIVVVEYGGLLEHAAGDDHGARAHLGHALIVDQCQPVICVVTGSKRATPHTDTGMSTHSFIEVTQQLQSPIASATLVSQAAADARILIDDAHLCTGIRASQGGG